MDLETLLDPDALLKALTKNFANFDAYVDMNPMQLMQSFYGPAGTIYGNMEGPWGAMTGRIVPKFQPASPLEGFEPFVKLLGLNS